MYSYTGKDLTALSSITVPLRVESELHQLSMTSLTCMRTIRYHFMNDWKDHRLMINHTSKVYDGPTYQGWLVHTHSMLLKNFLLRENKYSYMWTVRHNLIKYSMSDVCQVSPRSNCLECITFFIMQDYYNYYIY